jgi:hypothetical protein
MKINRLETHDRLGHFKSQAGDIGACCQNMIDQRPFGNHAFYIFAHKRTLGMDERFKLWMTGKYKTFESVPSATLIWQPRLTKPKSQTNSMLFKAYPGKDIVRVIWMIPERELWPQYTQGKLTENSVVCESIYNFENNRNKLDAKEPDDLTDDEVDAIYKDISHQAQIDKKKTKLLIPGD